MNIYLAGAIEHVDRDHAMGWRESVADYFAGSDIQCVNPFRRAGEGQGGTPAADKDGKLINRRDLHLTRQCHMILADLTNDVGRGTLIEIGMFTERNLPVFGWWSPAAQRLRDHPMLRDIVCAWDTNLRDLCDIIMEFEP